MGYSSLDNSSFFGSATALVTPFKEGKVDETTFATLVERQIKEGTHALVPMGTTGESPTLTHEEHKRVIELCVQIANGRVPVIAGAGSNSTEETKSLALFAQSVGAEAILSVVPYYNKPNQRGLYEHYKAVHDASDIPIFIYNIPGRSVVDMTNETLAKLSKLPRIIGVKDATADLARPGSLALETDKDFIQLSGEDATALPFLAAGGHGCISVTANVAPALCAQMHNAWKEGNLQKAQEINDVLLPLHDAMFIETSPVPVKYALSRLGLCEAEVRLPMVPLTKDSKKQVDAALEKAGLL